MRDDTVKERARERSRLSRRIARKHTDYDAEHGTAAFIPRFAQDVRVLRTCVLSLRRKDPTSRRSEREVCRLARTIFGLREKARAAHVPMPDLSAEISVLNETVSALVEHRLASNYGGLCNSGEALLNAYLDLYVTLTVEDASREIARNYDFLKYPLTGEPASLDVLLENFRLAFEFQGEDHYDKPVTMEKDKFKLRRCAEQGRILIPVNISQLSSRELSSLIVNSMAAFAGVRGVMVCGPGVADLAQVKANMLLSFSKAVQRIYLAHGVFAPTLEKLDTRASSYIKHMTTLSLRRRRTPVSSTTKAPRLHPSAWDLPLHEVYDGLKHVDKLRKDLREPRCNISAEPER